MNNLFLSAAALFILAFLPRTAMAQTYISSCTTIGSDGTYALSNNISTSSSSTACIVISGVSGGGYVSLDCGGYSISNTATVGPAPTLTIYGNSDPIFVQNCTVSAPNMPAGTWGAGESVGEYVGTSNVQYSTAYLQYMTYTNIEVPVDCASGMTCLIAYSTFNNSNVLGSGPGAVYINNNTFSSFMPSLPGDCAIEVDNANNAQINNNTITQPLDSLGNPRMDSDIQVVNTDFSGATTLSGYEIEGNTISNTFGYCIELAGQFTHMTIDSNSCTFGEQGIVGDWYYTSEDNLTVSNNFLYVPSNSISIAAGGLPVFNLILTSGSSFSSPVFTNNTFYNNTVSAAVTGSNYYSAFGDSSGSIHFSSYSNNSYNYNDLGDTVYFDATTGMIDLGWNYCTTAIPSGTITCH